MDFRTPPLNIIDVKPGPDARHQSGMRTATEIALIVLHATVGKNLAETLRWLTVNPNSGVSVHRLVDEQGRIHKVCDDLVIANHVGFSRYGKHYQGSPYGSVNRIALGIEILNMNDGHDPYEMAQIVSTALQVREWWGIYGVDTPIVWHGSIDTAGKTDPYAFPWKLFYSVLIAKCNEVW